MKFVTKFQIACIASLLLIAAACCVAQDKKPATPTAAAALKITEVQALSIQLCNSEIGKEELRYQATQQQWYAKRQTIIDEVEKANPGYKWHDAKSQGDQMGFLQQVPPAPSPAPAATRNGK